MQRHGAEPQTRLRDGSQNVTVQPLINREEREGNEGHAKIFL